MHTALYLLALTLAQPFAPGTMPQQPAGPSVQGAPVPGEHTEKIEVVGVQARQTGIPAMDPSLKPLGGVLKALPFDKYDLIFQNEKDITSGATGLYPVNDAYTVHVMLGPPLSQQEVALDVVVELKEGPQRLVALRASGQVPRGRTLLLRGLELPEGELLVLVTAKPPEDQESQDQQQQNTAGQQQQQDQQQQQQEQEQQESEEQEQQDPQEQQQEQQEQMAQQQEQEQQKSEDQEMKDVNPDELQNIEALLESLREQDRREQKNAQNRRQRVVVSGDWW